jgi:tRNA(Ile)-lysidine synthase
VLERIKKDIQSYRLFDETDQLALAISGGKDSVAVAHLLNEWGVPFQMVHVNFGLRGEDSDGDEYFLDELANNLTHCRGLIKRKVETKKYAEEHKLSTQEAARKLRYDFFDQLHKENCFTKLITAHHASDQLETFFINLYRKSGIKGLRGIPATRDYLIRPFLTVTQNELLNYLSSANLTHREDNSNSDSYYLRNRFRNKIIPEITKELPDFEARTLASMTILQKEQELFSELIKKEITRFVLEKGDTVEIQKKALLSFPQAGVMLYQIIDKYLFNYSQCEQIIKACQGASGKVFFSDTHQLSVDRSLIFIILKCENTGQVLTVSGPGEYMLENALLTLNNTETTTFTDDPNSEYVELNPLLFPLQWRYWQEGDCISPLGMKGTKLMSDFFIDLKIPVHMKSNIPLLCLQNEVLWVSGYRISDKIKVKHDKHLYKISVTFEQKPTL